MCHLSTSSMRCTAFANFRLPQFLRTDRAFANVQKGVLVLHSNRSPVRRTKRNYASCTAIENGKGISTHTMIPCTCNWKASFVVFVILIESATAVYGRPWTGRRPGPKKWIPTRNRYVLSLIWKTLGRTLVASLS